MTQLTYSPRATERPIRNQLDVMRDAILDDPVEHVLVVPDAQLDLHRGDVRDVSSLLDLTHIHIAQTDARGEPLIFQPRECTDARGERHSWIGCVQLVEIDALDAERLQAAFARFAQMTGSAIGHPLAVRSGKSSLRSDDEARTVAAPGRKGARDEPLVMADLRIVQAVRISRVEKRHTDIQRGMKYLDATQVITVALRGQPHTADSDGFHVCVMQISKCNMQKSSGAANDGRIVMVCMLPFAS